MIQTVPDGIVSSSFGRFGRLALSKRCFCLVMPVGGERLADLYLPFGKLSLLVSPDVTSVTLMGLNDFS